MQIRFAKPKLPKFHAVRMAFASMYKRCTFSNNGPQVQGLEKRMADLFEFDGEVVTCANGTIALMLAYKAMGCKKALVPSFTFPATLQALYWAGVDYEFVDIHPTKLTVDVEKLEEKLHETKADTIIPVHSFGAPCDVESIAALSAINDVKVIYDAAPAISSFVRQNNKNVHIANFGDISCFSLHATKVLQAGEGGVIFVKDKDLGKEIRSLCNFSFDGSRMPTSPFGINAKMSEIHAAFGYQSLQDLAYNQRDRLKIVNDYVEGLKDIVDFQEIEQGCISSHQVVPVLLKKEDAGMKEEMMKEMEKINIECRDYYSPPLHSMPIFKDANLPITDDICKRIITLPLHLWLRKNEVQHVVDSFRMTYNRIKG